MSNVIFITRSKSTNKAGESTARSGEFTRHTTSISFDFTEHKIRYTEVKGEIIKIEILDNSFNVDPDKSAEWTCVGDLFNVFMPICYDHLANL